MGDDNYNFVYALTCVLQGYAAGIDEVDINTDALKGALVEAGLEAELIDQLVTEGRLDHGSVAWALGEPDRREARDAAEETGNINAEAEALIDKANADIDALGGRPADAGNTPDGTSES